MILSSYPRSMCLDIHLSDLYLLQIGTHSTKSQEREYLVWNVNKIPLQINEHTNNLELEASFIFSYCQ